MLTDQEQALQLTDTASFSRMATSCISITTGLHDDYHKVSDDAQYINDDGMLAILDLLTQFLQHY